MNPPGSLSIWPSPNPIPPPIVHPLPFRLTNPLHLRILNDRSVDDASLNDEIADLESYLPSPFSLAIDPSQSTPSQNANLLSPTPSRSRVNDEKREKVPELGEGGGGKSEKASFEEKMKWKDEEEEEEQEEKRGEERKGDDSRMLSKFSSWRLRGEDIEKRDYCRLLR